MKYAGFRVRLGAYLIDFIPIVFILATVFYSFLGFDQTLIAYRVNPQDLDTRILFMSERNQIRDFSFLVWMIYAMFMEASVLQGTFGKRFVGIRVIGPDGGRISFGRSAARNLSKILSYLIVCLGFIWVAFTKQKHGWHDMIAKTDVVRGLPEDDHFDD